MKRLLELLRLRRCHACGLFRRAFRMTAINTHYHRDRWVCRACLPARKGRTHTSTQCNGLAAAFLSMTKLLLPIPKALKEIVRLHESVWGHTRKTVKTMIRIGELLTEIKGGLKHGEWLPWIEKNLPFDQKTAWNYMHVFELRDKLGTIPNLSITDVYRLLTSGDKAARDSEIAEERAKLAAKADKVKPSDRWTIHHADMREWQIDRRWT